jgi:predicted NBD/HSP70 family sugar kinase
MTERLIATTVSPLEQLIAAARSGDRQAEEKFLSKLAVRFRAIIAREVRLFPIIAGRAGIIEQSEEVCQLALAEFRRRYPLSHPECSIAVAANVLRQILDNFIANSLAEIARQEGDRNAENLLFSVIRKKLIQRLNQKWRTTRNEKCKEQ